MKKILKLHNLLIISKHKIIIGKNKENLNKKIKDMINIYDF